MTPPVGVQRLVVPLAIVCSVMVFLLGLAIPATWYVSKAGFTVVHDIQDLTKEIKGLKTALDDYRVDAATVKRQAAEDERLLNALEQKYESLDRRHRALWQYTHGRIGRLHWTDPGQEGD